MSTEFLGESSIALKAVLDAENQTLRPDERDELIAVISQVEFALRRRD